MHIAYIDSQNIHRGIQDQWRQIDWEKFFIYLKDSLRIDQVKIFIWYLESNTKFYSKLRNFWYIVVHKTAYSYIIPTIQSWKKTRETVIKGNVDSELVVEAMRDFYENNMTIWHLVSGDGDFTVLVNFWKEKKVLGRVFVPNVRKASVLLKQSAGNTIVDMGGLKPKIFRQ